MDKIIVEAMKREVTGKKVKALRREGKLPAVLYGYGVESTAIVMDHRTAGRTLSKAESSSLITIQLDGKEYPTLVREKQWDYIRRSLLHVDFLVVSMTEKIASQVRIELIGVAGAVEGFGAILIAGLSEVEIEALPADLPDSITVDVSVIENIGQGIFVRDLVVGSELTILSDPDAMIATATVPAAELSEADEEMMEGEEGEDGPEVIGESDDEEDEE